MDHIVVIANPVASQFTGGMHRDVMASLSKNHDVDAIWPSSTRETSRAAALAAADGASVVVAMGGDGMVHHVSQGLVGSGSTLAIIPVGTTNVVARLLGVPSRASRAVKLIDREPDPLRIGAVRLSLDRGSATTTHHAIFAAGFGLDAEVVIEADQEPYKKYRFGSIHYARSALRVGLGRFPRRRPNIRVTSSSRSTESATTLIQFRDVYTYFGRLPLRIDVETPAPMSVLHLNRLRRRRIPRILRGAMTTKGLGSIAEMSVWRGVTELELNADPSVAVQADGEALGVAGGARVEWVPNALKVIAGR